MFDLSIKKEIDDCLKDAIRLSKLIFSLYKRLINLEINGESDTKEYNHELFYLATTIKAEKVFYDSLIKKINIAYAAAGKMNCILNKKENNDLLNFESSLEEDDKDIIIDRAISLLDMVIMQYEISRNKKFRIPNSNDLDTEVIESYVDDEVFKKYILILQDNINNKLWHTKKIINTYRQGDYFEQIIKAKYKVSFNSPELETYLLKSKFKATSSIFNEYKDNPNMNKLDEEKFNSIKENYIIPLAEERAIALLDITDEELNSDKQIVDFILEQYSLRGLLLMLNEDEVKNLKDNILEKMLYSNGSQMGVAMAIDAFTITEEDREKHFNNTVMIK
jgi:hypothetical protein